MLIYCCECKKEVQAPLYQNETNIFYQCPICGNTVLCFKGTKRPKGNIAGRELKKKRQCIYNIIDDIIKYGKITKMKIHKMLSELMGYPVHIAETKTIHECNEIIKYLQGIYECQRTN